MFSELIRLTEEPPGDSAASASLSSSQLLVVAGGVLVAALLATWAGWLLNKHYRASREKNEDGKYTGARSIDVTFARVVGLLSIAALGTVGLSMSLVVDADLVSAYFTLLGTIAGYLIGAKTGSAQSTERAPDANGDIVTTESRTPTLG